MSTPIDSLQIQIQTSSTNAAIGIRDLSAALAELKKSGTLTTVVKNLKGLSEALSSFASVSNAVSNISSLSTALAKLKSVGSFTTLANSIKALPAALNNLSQIGDIKNVEAKVKNISAALSSLGDVKASGFTSAVNSLKKISEVTKSLDETTITEFKNKVEKLTDALGPLSQKLTTVKSALDGFSKEAKASGKKTEDLKLNMDAINFDAFIGGIQKAIHALFQLASKMKDVIAQAIEWDGISARFGRGFGTQADETYTWIQRLNKEMGINVQNFMQYSSTYATMLKGFGVANEDASKMALGYMELTYDIWAGYNDIYKTFDEASDAVRSAIAGEVEPIRKAGFTIVEATLEMTAANFGITKSLESMTEAEKSYLRYLTLVDQSYSQNLVGTYAKELETAEGLMRTASQQLKSLTQALGSLFLPLLTRVMPYVQAFVELLTELVHTTGELHGIKIQEVDWSGYNEGSAAISSVEDAANGATSALKDAEKEAKSLKNATLGLDELNIISVGTKKEDEENAFADLDINSLWDKSIFDNIQSNVKQIKEDLKEWLPSLEEAKVFLGDILKIILSISAGIAIPKIGSGVNNLFKNIEKLFNSKTGKLSIGLSVMITGLTFAFDNAFSIGYEGASIENVVKTAISSALGVVGSLVAFGTGPVGWIVGIGLALVANIVGISVGTNKKIAEQMRQGIASMLSVENGTTLDQFTIDLGVKLSAITEDFGNFEEYRQQIEASSESVSRLTSSIDGMASAIMDGEEAFETYVPKILDSLEELRVESEKKLTAIRDSLIEALAGGLGEGLENVDKYVGDVNKIWDATMTQLDKLEVILGDSTQMGTPEWIEAWEQYQKLIGESKTLTEEFSDTVNAIDWSGILGEDNKFDIGKLQSFAGQISNALKTTTEDIGKYYGGIESDLRVMLENATQLGMGQDIIDRINELINNNSANWELEKSNVRDIAQSSLDFLQADILTKSFEVIEEAKVGYAGLTGWQKFWMKDSTEAGYVKKELQDFQDNYVEELSDEIEKIFKALGIEGAEWASDAMQQMIDGLFTFTSYTHQSAYSKDAYSDGIAGQIIKALMDSGQDAKPFALKVAKDNYGLDLSNGFGSQYIWETGISASGQKVVQGIKDTQTGNVIQLTPDLRAVLEALGISFSFAASGGMFEQGSMIWAGERGAEIVANASGGKTGVMNVQQMYQAVYDATYSAMVATRQTQQQSGGSYNLYIDGKQVATSVEKTQKNRGATIFGTEVYSF